MEPKDEKSLAIETHRKQMRSLEAHIKKGIQHTLELMAADESLDNLDPRVAWNLFSTLLASTLMELGTQLESEAYLGEKRHARKQNR